MSGIVEKKEPLQNLCKLEEKPICHGNKALPDWGCTFYVEMSGYCALGHCEFLDENGFCMNETAVMEAFHIERSYCLRKVGPDGAFPLTDQEKEEFSGLLVCCLDRIPTIKQVICDKGCVFVVPWGGGHPIFICDFRIIKWLADRFIP